MRMDGDIGRQTPRRGTDDPRPRAAQADAGQPRPGTARRDVAARARDIERQLVRRQPVPSDETVAGQRSGGSKPRRPTAGRAPGGSHAAGRSASDGAARRGAPGSPPQGGARPRRAEPSPAQGRHSAPPRRRRGARFSGGLFFASAAVVILSLAWVITTLIELPARRAEAASLAAASAAGVSTGTPQPHAGIGPALAENTAYTPPSAALLALPESGRVDMRYFDDALFIGDSLTRGFQEYASGIPGAKYAAYIGVGPRQFMEGLVQNRAGEQVAAIDEILAAAPKKVYLLLGTNSMATLSDEAFLKYYEDLLDFLMPQLPSDTVYYLQAIPPVTAAKMESDENFSLARIRGLNESLAGLAYRKGMYFLDLFSALADETGALRADIASGEIHLNDSGYSLWREFLITHTAYRKENPYLPGSPYYVTAG